LKKTDAAKPELLFSHLQHYALNHFFHFLLKNL